MVKENFSLRSETRQECPLLPFKFKLKDLASAIRQEKENLKAYRLESKKTNRRHHCLHRKSQRINNKKKPPRTNLAKMQGRHTKINHISIYC